MQALHFAKNSRYYFFVGCIASGVFGMTSSYIAAQMTAPPTSNYELVNSSSSVRAFGFFLNAAKCIAALLSCTMFFVESLPAAGWVCVVVNLFAGFFIPPPMDPTASAELAGFRQVTVVRTDKSIV